MKMMKKGMYPLVTIYSGTLTLLRERVFRMVFMVLIALFLALYVMLPVWFIPGNDLAFQLGLFSPAEWGLLVILSTFTALLIVMQVFLFARIGRKAFSDGGSGILSGMFATLVGTAGCVGCSLGIALGFLGFGTIVFFIEYQFYIASGALLVFLVAMYLIARRIEGHCRECEVL